MSDKSYVGMGCTVCPICMTGHDEVVLLHKRFANVFEKYGNKKEVMGFGLCPDCEAKRVEYVAVVEVTEPPRPDQNPLQWKRTGKHAHIRRSVVPRILNVPVSDDQPMILAEDGFVAKLEEMTRFIERVDEVASRTFIDDMVDSANAVVAGIIHRLAEYHKEEIAKGFEHSRTVLGLK